jgi:hypothetical protein
VFMIGTPRSLYGGRSPRHEGGSYDSRSFTRQNAYVERLLDRFAGNALIMSSCPGSAAASRAVGLHRVPRGASGASVARHGLADIAVNDMPGRSAIVAIPFCTSDSCIATG